jgi:hypothetical protein
VIVSLLFACGSPTVTHDAETHEAAPSEPVAAAPVEAAAPVAAAAPGAQDPDWKYFGAPFALASALPASTVLAAPEQHAGKPLRMTGELTEVCQKMGCWAVVADDAGHQVRILMKDHTFGIDKDTAGRACDVEGELVKKQVDPEQVAHYESEGSKNAPETGKTEVYEFVAASVAVKRT